MKTANKVRSFPRGRPADTIPQALRELKSAGLRALYGPEFGEARIKYPANHELSRWHRVLTGIYFGRTERGTGVVIGVHRPHYLSTPEDIEAAIYHRLINGAAATQEVAREIPRLLDLEGNGVVVEDYKNWEKAKSGLIPLEEALNHPAAKLILGGRAGIEKYIEGYHSKRFGAEQIGIWKSNDLKEIPVAHLVWFGDDYDNVIYADRDLQDYGRFAVVQRAEGTAWQKTASKPVGNNGLVAVKLDPEDYRLLNKLRDGLLH